MGELFGAPVHALLIVVKIFGLAFYISDEYDLVVLLSFMLTDLYFYAVPPELKYLYKKWTCNGSNPSKPNT